MFLNPMITIVRSSAPKTLSRTIRLMIENPQADVVTMSVYSDKASMSIRTRKKVCDISQWSIPLTAVSGRLHLYGNCKK
jgi:hypothetical protein